MSLSRKELGAWGENVSVQYLQEKGYTILSRNWRCKLGELDLVAQEGATIVFVEVKTKVSSPWGPPEQSVTRAKQRTLRLLAQLFLRALRKPRAPYRIDVLAITTRQDDGPPEILHLKDAVQDW